jgi:hypothetical protein
MRWKNQIIAQQQMYGALFWVFLQPQHLVKRRAAEGSVCDKLAKPVANGTWRSDVSGGASERRSRGLDDRMDSPCQIFGIIVPRLNKGMKESMYAVYDDWG